MLQYNVSKLDGKFAFVTGGARGIGRAIAERLATCGSAVAIGYHSRPDAAARVVSAIQEYGGEAFAVHCDISDERSLVAALDQVRERFGALDILVNNAGGSPPARLVADGTSEAFDQAFALAKGTYLALGWAARHLSDNGRIINILTSLTTGFWPNNALYVGYKGALEQISRTLSREIGDRGITVNVVSPGPIHTDANADPHNHVRLAAQTSLGRVGEPQDVAAAVTFLASPEASFITGQNIVVNGGIR